MRIPSQAHLQGCRRFYASRHGDKPGGIEPGLEDIVRNYARVSSAQERMKLLLQVSLGALRDPERADLVSACGDLSSHAALAKLQRKMEADEEGKEILRCKPRVTPTTWNIDHLLTLPTGTFGHEYASWMSAHGYSSAERPLVKYVPNLEHAYILQRYKEVHDVAHVLLGYGTTVTEEIAVKWFELQQTELPMSALAAFIGPLNLVLF